MSILLNAIITDNYTLYVVLFSWWAAYWYLCCIIKIQPAPTLVPAALVFSNLARPFFFFSGRVWPRSRCNSWWCDPQHYARSCGYHNAAGGSWSATWMFLFLHWSINPKFYHHHKQQHLVPHQPSISYCHSPSLLWSTATCHTFHTFTSCLSQLSHDACLQMLFVSQYLILLPCLKRGLSAAGHINHFLLLIYYHHKHRHHHQPIIVINVKITCTTKHSSNIPHVLLQPFYLIRSQFGISKVTILHTLIINCHVTRHTAQSNFTRQITSVHQAFAKQRKWISLNFQQNATTAQSSITASYLCLTIVFTHVHAASRYCFLAASVCPHTDKLLTRNCCNLVGTWTMLTATGGWKLVTFYLSLRAIFVIT